MTVALTLTITLTLTLTLTPNPTRTRIPTSALALPLTLTLTPSRSVHADGARGDDGDRRRRGRPLHSCHRAGRSGADLGRKEGRMAGSSSTPASANWPGGVRGSLRRALALREASAAAGAPADHAWFRHQVLSPASRLDLSLVIGFSNRALLRIGLSMACGFWVAMVAC